MAETQQTIDPQKELAQLRERCAEWERYFYEHKSARDEGYNAARARYWPKFENARTEAAVLRTALHMLFTATADIRPVPGLGSARVAAEAALRRSPLSVDTDPVIAAAQAALPVLEGRAPLSADVATALRIALYPFGS